MSSTGKKLVGVLIGDPPAVTEDLKQQLLFLDQVGIVDLPQIYERLQRRRPSFDPTAADLAYLESEKLIFNVTPSIPAELMDDDKEIRAALDLAVDATLKYIDQIATIPPDTTGGALGAAPDSFVLAQKYDSDSRSYVCRALAGALRAQHDVDAVSLLYVPSTSQPAGDFRDDAIRVVIKSLPMPDDSVPWDEILAFRNESEHVNRLLALRTWTSDLGRGKLTAHELQEKLEYLMNDYESNLRLLRLSSRRGVFEIVITTLAGVAEDFVKLKWEKLLKGLFDLRRERTKLLLEEKKVPGREIAYVVQAHQKFGAE